MSLLPGARLPPCSRTMDVLSFPELASALALDPSWLAPYVPQQADLSQLIAARYLNHTGEI